MKIRSTKERLICDALEKVNVEFDNNIKFKRYEVKKGRKGYIYTVTLTVQDSRGAGSRIGVTGRRVVAACWHAHGRFIDHIFDLDKSAIVWTMGKIKYNASSWRWVDRNIGSILDPFYLSNACDCC